MLLAEKLVSGEQLEEGLEAQVVHGGRLGTNLVELGFLKEGDLARTLGRQHNLSFASGEMFPDPNALAVADADFMDQHDVVPMRMDTTRLMVAVLDPRQLAGIDQLGFKAGRKVVPVVIPEFRMHQLLRKHAKAFRTLRPLDMNTLRPAKKANEPRPADVQELINEDDFAALYANALEGGDALGGGAPDAPVQGVLEEPAAPPPPPEPATPGFVILKGKAPRAPDAAPGVPWPAEPLGAPSPPAVPARPAPQAGAPPSPGRAAPAQESPPASPLTFAEAQALLQKSQDREDIARTVLRFAVSKFRRALILSVRGDLLSGWHGVGKGVADRAVARIGLSLKEQNTFKLVRDLRSHYVGPMKQGAGTTFFFQLLGAGGGYPGTAVILPLLVRGKVVHMLYVDNGPAQLTPPDVGELLILGQSVGRSYEALIRARKA